MRKVCICTPKDLDGSYEIGNAVEKENFLELKRANQQAQKRSWQEEAWRPARICLKKRQENKKNTKR